MEKKLIKGQPNIEILAPAGSYESLKAAVHAGADAVYTGGGKFGARAYADNLDETQLLEAIDYVHLHGRKIYLTINTLLKEKELKEELYAYLRPYYEQGLDAVIVQDIGVLSYIKQQFPGLPIHISTQMTITNLLGAQFMEREGAERVVPARELSLEEIREIVKHTNLEVECFVHGALCYCYSGQCLYSSLIGGRSGNRGQCAQPCRLPYRLDDKKQSSYLLSPKDICTLEEIPDLIDAGIHSFKIEGRMKKPEYVAAVTAIYRKYVDLYLERGRNGFQVLEEDKTCLMDLYNRGGFHEGYYHTRNGREMMSLTRPNHAGVPALKIKNRRGKELTTVAMTALHPQDVIEIPGEKNPHTLGKRVEEGEHYTFFVSTKSNLQAGTVLYRTKNESLQKQIKEQIIDRKLQEKINGEFILCEGKSARLKVEKGGIFVVVEGDIAQQALTRAIEASVIEKQLRKTGNSQFVFNELVLEVGEGLFLPLQSLNEMRRQALAKLEEAICKAYHRESVPFIGFVKKSENQSIPFQGFFAYVETQEQYEIVRGYESIKRIYLSDTLVPVSCEKEQYLVTPYIFRKETKKRLDMLYDMYGSFYDGTLVHNYESYEYLQSKDYNKPIVMDYNMYQFNHMAKEFWDGRAASGTASVELNAHELQEVGCENSELIVYGHLPMMVSAQCVRKNTKECTHRSGYMTMTDRMQKEFVVKNCCENCYNVIYNSEPLVLADQKDAIKQLQPKALRLHFTIEDGKKVWEVLRLYEETLLQGSGRKNSEFAFTRGHFKRGVK